MNIIKTNKHVFELIDESKQFNIDMTNETIEPGLDNIHITLKTDTKIIPKSITIKFNHPVVDIQSLWDTGSGRRDKGLGTHFTSKSTSMAPVVCLLNIEGKNRLTFAFSDCMNPVDVKAWIIEETAEYDICITLFKEPLEPLSEYEAVLRVDTRDIPFYESLSDVTSWWALLPGYKPSDIPVTAKYPMYSTWYSFHQNLVPEKVENNCKIAKQLGCEAVIVDDGWQTSDNHRGYAYCGDWEPSLQRIPDMKKHVDNIHKMGMKFILWYSVPFVGIHSKAWEKFKGKYLDFIEPLGAAVLDVRFPEVREYLINIYEKALKEWDLDGFKLDFVDSFYLAKGKEEFKNGRDYDSVPKAVDRLLTDVIERLRKIKPDIMIEFRQSYIGPLMRKYGNMFRVGDCPNDTGINRVNTIDLRLLSGDTAVHSDMMMWHIDDSVESAALQVMSTMFAVQQISVLLDKYPQEHIKMLEFFLKFWRENRDTLLSGELKPERPDMSYPLVKSVKDGVMIAGVYADYVLSIDENYDNIIAVNAKYSKRVVIDSKFDLGNIYIKILNVFGETVDKYKYNLNKGIHSFDAPACGYIYINKK